MSKINWEYVISGTNHFGGGFLGDPSVKYGDEVRERIGKIFKESQGLHGTNYAVLFNAFVEVILGKGLHLTTDGSVSNIYADSGGLQIVTQGLTATPALKKEVYMTQAHYSDIGMSFDEIPVRLIGDKSSRGNSKDRWFDISIFEAKARETGRNVLAQINTFLEEKSNTKPALIIQGNCLETYQKWCDYVLDEIPSSKHKYIQCVAMGAAALGQGANEEVFRATIFPFLPVYEYTHHLHLLGIGAYSRLVPYFIAKETVYADDIYISYDSSRHASDVIFGRYHYADFTELQVPRYVLHDTHHLIFRDIISKFGEDALMGFGIDDLYYMTTNSGGNVISNPKYGERILKTYFQFLWTMGSILNFTRDVQKLSNKETLLDTVNQNNRKVYETLYEVKSLDDYLAWDRDIGRYLKSDRVSSHAPNPLDTLFE